MHSGLYVVKADSMFLPCSNFSASSRHFVYVYVCQCICDSLWVFLHSL